MSQLWWQMPGPRRFAQRIATSLREGKNALVQLPAGYPEGLRPAVQLQSNLPTDRWRLFTLGAGATYRPLDLLFAQFTGTRPGNLLSVNTLADLPRFKGHTIWIEGVDGRNWPLWRQFILDYEHACRAIDERERSVFCLMLVGPVANEAITPLISLDIWRYEQIAGLLDVLLYTATIMPESGIMGVKRRVAIATIAQLALWDPIVCERMVSLPLGAILRPSAVLCDIAHRRGWNCVDGKLDWCYGTLQTVDGKQQQHSAIYAIQQDEREIARRVWVAQLSEIFPLLEQRRQDLLRDLDTYLNVPFTTSFGEVITEKENLELGHIMWQLNQLRQAGRRDIRIQQALEVVIQLKKMRDALAHLKVLDEEYIVF